MFLYEMFYVAGVGTIELLQTNDIWLVSLKEGED